MSDAENGVDGPQDLARLAAIRARQSGDASDRAARFANYIAWLKSNENATLAGVGGLGVDTQ
jgi:hypothetical protein